MTVTWRHLASLVLASTILCAPMRFDHTRMVEPRMTGKRMLAARMLDAQRDSPSFDLGFNTGGYRALFGSVTIGGVTQAMSVRYLGEDGDLTDWNQAGSAGVALILQAGTAPTIDTIVPTKNTADRAVDFNGGGYYQSADTTTGGVGAKDIFIEVVARMSSSDVFILDKGTATDERVSVATVSGAFRLLMEDTSGNSVAIDSAALTEGAWYYAAVCVNKSEASSNGSQWWVNAAQSGSGADFSAVGDTTNAGALTIGASSAGASQYDERVAYVAVAARDSWIADGATGIADCQATIRERLARLEGVWPDVHLGTGVPNIAARATTKTVFKAGEMFTLGANWLDTVGGAYTAEGAISNKMLQSEDFSTSWNITSSQADSISTNTLASPGGPTTADSFVTTAVAVERHLNQVYTTTVASWTLSVWVKSGSASHVALYDTDATSGRHFDLSDCSLGGNGGFAGPPTSSDAEDYGSGWCRCWISITGNGSSSTFRIYPSAGSNTTTTGDGAVAIYVWGAQAELADHMTSYMPTTVAAADRSSDLLQYKMDDGNLANGSPAALTVEVVQGTRLAYTQKHTFSYMAVLSDGGSTADNLISRQRVTICRAESVTTATGESAGAVNGPTNKCTSTGFTHRYTLTEDSLIQYVDGVVDGNEDTDVGVADNLDELDIGNAANNIFPFNNPINRVRVWTTVQVP